MPKRESPHVRIWRYIGRMPSDGCWLWTGAKQKPSKRGPKPNATYGAFHWDTERGKVRAHRAMFEIVNGPIPDGEVIRHTCDNPLCVRPSHLVAGSQGDNLQDAYDRGRHPRTGGRRFHKDYEPDPPF